MNARYAAVLLLGSALVGLGRVGYAQELRFDHIGSDQGLSHNSIYAITQDHQGFLWFGTADGLNRYDGYTFTVYRYDPADTASLSNNLVWAVLEDRAHNLWVGTENGLNRLDRSQERFTRYSMPEDRSFSVYSLLEDRGGGIWAGTSKGLLRYDASQDRFSWYGPEPENPYSLDHPHAVDLAEDSEGRLWVLTWAPDSPYHTLHTFEPASGRFLRYRLGNATLPTPAPFSDILPDASGRVWISGSGFGMFDPDQERYLPLPQTPALGLTYALSPGRQGRIWVGSLNGLYQFDPGGRTFVRHLTDPSQPPGLQDEIRALFEDQAGTLWVGTHAGLYRLDPAAKPFRHLRHDPASPNSLSSPVVMAMVEDGGGSLWAGTYGGGLNRVDAGRERVQVHRHLPGEPASLPSDIVWDVHEDRQGRLWIGTAVGLCEYQAPGRFIRHRLSKPGTVEPSVFFIAEDREALWLGTNDGLYRYSLQPPRQVRHYPATGDERGPSSSNIASLYVQDEQTVWLGMEGYLDKLDLVQERFTAYQLAIEPGSSLISEGIWQIHPGGDGRLWLATGAGLSRFDPAARAFRYYFQRDGLPGSVVYSILEEAPGRFWLGTNHGLAHAEADSSGGLRVRTFDVRDGTGSTEFNRHAAFQSPRGEFFFGGMNGLTTFFPSAIRDNPYLPPVALTRIEASNRHGTTVINPYERDELKLSYRDYSFSFEFAALNFTNPSKNRYAYRLDGFESAWVEADTRRFARYTNIPPGHYVFRVRGSNNDGQWNNEGIALHLTITPPFWETWLFRMLAVGLAIGLVYGLYRYRVARLLELERLRLRIAGDLHDDLSSDLSGIALVADLMQRRAYLEEPDRQRLADVQATTLHMLDALRDLVWYINPEHDTLEALALRMRQMAATLLQGLDYTFRTEPDSFAGQTDMAVRRHVFLMFKEILHNIVRHAQAAHVRIELRRDGEHLIVIVEDDGIGFDPATATGNGLTNLRARSDQIGATFHLDSRPGYGTRVRLVVKMARTRDGVG